MSGAPTSFSIRSSVTEHGMAYEARALRARSANSTRGSHAPPGGTGEPCTGGSGTGGWRVRSCEVREMRNAVAARTLVRGARKKATGELIDTETVTISSEGGRWKSTHRGNSLAAYPTSRPVLRRGGESNLASLSRRICRWLQLIIRTGLHRSKMRRFPRHGLENDTA
jgi:hypothetical protein